MLSRRLIAVLAALILSAGCGNDSPTAPSTPQTPAPQTPTPPPAPTLYNLQGTIRSANGNTPIPGAIARIADGPNAGAQAATDGAGIYRINGLTFAGFTLEILAPGHAGATRGGILQQGVTTATANFTLLPAQLWTHSGTGDNVFDMPSYITRVRVTGTYTRFSSNFIVHINGRSFVNELLGTGWDSTRFEGTYQVTPGRVEILSSSGVAWSFTEVR